MVGEKSLINYAFNEVFYFKIIEFITSKIVHLSEGISISFLSLAFFLYLADIFFSTLWTFYSFFCIFYYKIRTFFTIKHFITYICIEKLEIDNFFLLYWNANTEKVLSNLHELYLIIFIIFVFNKFDIFSLNYMGIGLRIKARWMEFLIIFK